MWDVPGADIPWPSRDYSKEQKDREDDQVYDALKHLNLALGSALASIGLTIPVVAGVSIVIRQPLELGLGTKDQVLSHLRLTAN